MKPFPFMPGVPAAGHISGGFWHPGSEHGCVKCSPRGRARNADGWSCWRNAAHTTHLNPVLGWPECAECGAKPQYHERARLAHDDLILGIYVPAPNAPIRAIIEPGSGIVALPATDTGRLTVYYEGWVHGAGQYEDRDARGRWEAGVEHAADRLVTQYPTSATASVRRDEIELVGHYYPRPRSFDVFEPQTVSGWVAA